MREAFAFWTACRIHLVRRRLFTLVIVASVATAAASAAFVSSAAYATLLAPLPFAEPEQLFVVWEQSGDTAFDRAPLSPRTYLALSAHTDVVPQLGAATSCVPQPLVTRDGRAQELSCQLLTPNLPALLGIRAEVGTFFSRPNAAERVVVISHKLWLRHFDGAPTAVGSPLSLGGTIFTVVGVAPPSFELLSSETDIWLPLHFGEGAQGFEERYLTGIGRLGGHRTLPQLESLLREARARQSPDSGLPKVSVGGLQAELTRTVRPFVMGAAGGGVAVVGLVIANCSFLFAAYRLSRKPDYHVRICVGATGADLRSLHRSTSVLLALLASGTAACLAAVLAPLLASTRLGFPEVPITADWAARLPWMAPLISAGLAAAITLLSSVTGAWLVPVSPEPAAPLASGRMAGALLRGLQPYLLVIQVAAALALSIAAIELSTSTDALRRQALGFGVDNVLTGRITLSGTEWSPQARLSALEDIVSHVGGLPGVANVAYVRGLPLAAPLGNRAAWFSRDRGREWDSVVCVPSGRDAPRVSGAVRLVSSGYLATMQIPVLEGRALATADYALGAKGAVVSRSMARRLSLDRLPASVRCQGLMVTDTFTINGIVGDVRDVLSQEEPRPAIYVPYAVRPLAAVALVVRTTSPVDTAGDTIWSGVRARLPGVPLVDTLAMTERVRLGSLRSALVARVFLIGAGVSLLVALGGTFGLVSYLTRSGGRDLSIRSALGATPFELHRVVLRRITRTSSLASCWADGQGPWQWSSSRPCSR